MADKTPVSTYRWAAFTHWMNLAFLVAGGVAGGVVDPSLWAVTGAAELGVLWVLPDLPMFKAAYDEKTRRARLLSERAYFLNQLWSIPIPAEEGLWSQLKSIFVAAPATNPHAGLMNYQGNDMGAEFGRFREMLSIVEKLRSMAPLQNVRVSNDDIDRLEEVINGYLRILVACRPLASSLSTLDAEELDRDLKLIDKRIAGADSNLRPVLLERKRILQGQADRYPKVQATLELLHARAESISYQLKNIHSQVLADPGTEVNQMLDAMVEKNDVMADPLGDLKSDRGIREYFDVELQGRQAQLEQARKQAAAMKGQKVH